VDIGHKFCAIGFQLNQPLQINEDICSSVIGHICREEMQCISISITPPPPPPKKTILNSESSTFGGKWGRGGGYYTQSKFSPQLHQYNIHWELLHHSLMFSAFCLWWVNMSASLRCPMSRISGIIRTPPKHCHHVAVKNPNSRSFICMFCYGSLIMFYLPLMWQSYCIVSCYKLASNVKRNIINPFPSCRLTWVSSCFQTFTAIK